MTAISQLEELAMNAWPAEVIQMVEGWRLRFTEGVSRRANSAWSNQPTGSTPLSDRLDQVEAFYRARGTSSCFHVSPLSPTNLDPVLAERGYSENGNTDVQSASVEEVLTGTSPTPATGKDWKIELHPAPTASWEQVTWPSRDLRPEVRREILARIGPPKVCALAREQGRPVAAGLGVCERGHIGIFSMRTLESARGRGLAGAVLHSLVSWGRETGARIAYLQVEKDNPPAQRVYARAGFQSAYAYHYRSRAMAGLRA
jgi:GNAT superfamily N-acetyltransferase